MNRGPELLGAPSSGAIKILGKKIIGILRKTNNKQYVCFPDVVTACTIFIDSSRDSGNSNERSFSKFMLLKTLGPICDELCLHARLSDLGILSIERDRFSEIDNRKVL